MPLRQHRIEFDHALDLAAGPATTPTGPPGLHLVCADGRAPRLDLAAWGRTGC